MRRATSSALDGREGAEAEGFGERVEPVEARESTGNLDAGRFQLGVETLRRLDAFADAVDLATADRLVEHLRKVHTSHFEQRRAGPLARTRASYE